MVLHVIRHGKALSQGEKDFDRALHPIGIRQSLFLNEYFLEHSQSEFITYYSTAKRTLQTMELITQNLKSTQVGQVSLYGADFMTLFKFIENSSIQQDLILIAHNPGVSRLIEYLTGERFYCKTGTLTSIHFDIQNWAELSANTGQILAQIRWNDEQVI